MSLLETDGPAMLSKFNEETFTKVWAETSNAEVSFSRLKGVREWLPEGGGKVCVASYSKGAVTLG